MEQLELDIDVQRDGMNELGTREAVVLEQLNAQGEQMELAQQELDRTEETLQHLRDEMKETAAAVRGWKLSCSM
ncbi:hypothetical protein RE628_07550 [Paenibacillus sp. D2_2]|uniref:hypothetical protein n=1 Tax=Paenibacillus sp. D2_2 TaxID=3073092 RepID=UPI00281567A5|nr:hypothetical protein [Paenibacillus sp. D2_2]WMT42250.1 hypothetical protein RE628_07550 [Paenibacillus sp. D2_2]